MAAELTSTLQSASINRHPSPTHDLNPSTVASRKEPVYLGHQQKRGRASSSASSASVDTDEVPLSALRQVPRTSTLPPLPELRFEQSYMKSLEGVNGWRGVAWVTIRDQVVAPLVQGVVWTLVLSGWRFWNRRSKLSGTGAGARLRRWWWQVNNWEVPKTKSA